MTSNLEGSYQIDKTNVVNSKYHLVIGTRKKPTPDKPKYYLLHRLSPTNHKYISSLYTINGQEMAKYYSFEWQGQHYTLTYLDGQDKAEIRSAIMPVKGVAGSNP